MVRDGPPGGRALPEMSGSADSLGPRSLGAGLDLERHPLSADEAVEVEGSIERVAMEEVVLRILGGDEAETAISDDLFDSTRGHRDLLGFPNSGVRRTVRSRRGSTTRIFARR
jgi:hypothetical protein